MFRAKTKTDNSSLRLKIFLRERIIQIAQLSELSVLDLCAGQGLIWQDLGERLKVIAYTPCDKKPRIPGCIKGDLSDRFLDGFNLAHYNVIDIDTYGEPWQPWWNLFNRIKRHTAMFLTHGAISGGGGCNVSQFARELMGIPKDWPVPMKKELAIFAARYILGARSLTSCIEAGYRINLANVTYYGLICEPKQKGIT